MRMSVDKNDPGYATWQQSLLDGTSAVVLLDGVDQKSAVITADDQEGFVERLRKGRDGSYIFDKLTGKYESEVVRGRVEIQMRPAVLKRSN